MKFKDVRKKYRGKEQKSVDKLIMQKGIDKVQKHHDKNALTSTSEKNQSIRQYRARFP